MGGTANLQAFRQQMRAIMLATQACSQVGRILACYQMQQHACLVMLQYDKSLADILIDGRLPFFVMSVSCLNLPQTHLLRTCDFVTNHVGEMARSLLHVLASPPAALLACLGTD